MFTRKSLIASLTASSMLLLVGCHSTSIATTQAKIAQAAQDTALIASGLKAALPALGTAFKIDPVTLTKVTYAVADLQNLATQLQQASTVTQAQSIVALVENDVNAVVASVSSAQGLPDNVQKIVAATAVVLPVIETAVNMAVSATPSTTPPTAAALPKMPVNVALGILQGAPALVH